MSLPKKSGYTLIIVLIWMFVISLIFGGFFYTKINYPFFFNRIVNLSFLSEVKFLPILQDTVKPALNEAIGFYIDEKFTKDYNGPHIFLNVNTRKDYPCIGYGINHSITHVNRQIFVDLGEIQSPSISCVSRQQPASFNEDLYLDPGDYLLELKGKGTDDKYNIKVSSDKIMIENDPLTNAIFSTPITKELIRLPKDLIEIRCFYNSSAPKNTSNHLCQDFFGAFRDIASSFITPPPDILSINQYYLYRGNDQQLMTIVKRYQRKNTDYNISVSTWQGKKFTCSVDSCQTTKATFPTLEIEY